MAAPVTPFVNSLRGVIRSAQSLIQGLGLRPTYTTIRTRTWSEGEVRLGTPIDSDLVLTPTPKVTIISPTEVEVGPIVPSYSGGGYTVAQLNPIAAITGTTSPGVEVFYILDGPNGVYNYTLVSLETRRPFRYLLKLQLLYRAQPV